MSNDKPKANPAGVASKAAAANLKKNQPPKPDKPKDERSHEQIRKDVVKNRQDLAETLDALEFKLNVPKQARFAAQRLTKKIQTLREENPAVLVAGAATAAAVLGTGIWLGVRAISRR
jgi:hypothetical protein